MATDRFSDYHLVTISDTELFIKMQFCVSQLPSCLSTRFHVLTTKYIKSTPLSWVISSYHLIILITVRIFLFCIYLFYWYFILEPYLYRAIRGRSPAHSCEKLMKCVCVWAPIFFVNLNFDHTLCSWTRFNSKYKFELLQNNKCLFLTKDLNCRGASTQLSFSRPNSRLLLPKRIKMAAQCKRTTRMTIFAASMH